MATTICRTPGRGANHAAPRGGADLRGRSFLVAGTLLVAAVSFTACKRNPSKSQPPPPIVNKPLPPPPPPAEAKYAGASPAHPFAKQPGAYYARTLFESDAPGNSHVEIRDVLIPPRSKSNLAALPGSAVMDLAAGQVSVSIGGKAEGVAAGTMRSLPAGQALALENADSHPAIVRLYVIRAR
jgi:hypothetical protein